ncbi:hypothetical protein PHMEG_00020053 [Phytophthora megakarya]|uniref:RxLR effector protein n=1 Tax=Phytophthora megakarya TaxID=4795 RepID=A0A225VR82_9STRA|nr:hypothetical protein PHMEG_00020053 [Phytophthora megakarya]
MHLTSVLAFSTFALVQVISAKETLNDLTTPTPSSKLRGETNVPPPHAGERQLGFFDWLTPSSLKPYDDHDPFDFSVP